MYFFFFLSHCNIGNPYRWLYLFFFFFFWSFSITLAGQSAIDDYYAKSTAAVPFEPNTLNEQCSFDLMAVISTPKMLITNLSIFSFFCFVFLFCFSQFCRLKNKKPRTATIASCSRVFHKYLQTQPSVVLNFKKKKITSRTSPVPFFFYKTPSLPSSLFSF